MRQFAGFLNLRYGVDELHAANRQHVRSWVVSLMQEKSQPVTIRRKVSSLAHFYRWMNRKGHTNQQPVMHIQTPKLASRLPESLPENAIRQLWTQFEGVTDQEGYPVLRDKVMIGLLYGCGLRRSEVINLKWSAVNFSQKSIRVFGKGKKFRHIPLGHHLQELLMQLQASATERFGKDPEQPVILTDAGKPVYPKYVHNKVVAWVGRVTTAKKRSPHVLRHSMATHLLDHGAELNAIKELLGHSSLAATQVYTHNSMARLMDVYRKSHPAAERK